MGLVALAVLLLACLTALGARGPSVAGGGAAGHEDGLRDVALYGAIVDGVRHGGNYYKIAADALRAGDYPLAPFVAFRLPTLAVVEARLPPRAASALLYLLAALTLLSWYRRLRPALIRTPPAMVMLILLAAGLTAFVQTDLVALHEIWAGLFVALSLASRRPDRWIAAAALGLCAMLIRETAALYVGVMALAALLERRSREFAGWCAVTGVFAVVVALHAHAVAGVVRPLDQVSPGWSGTPDFGFFVRAIDASTALTLAPTWLAALLVGFALFGWATWRDALAVRALGTLVAYAALLSLAARAGTFYWALMVAPTLLAGLVFVPDGLRDIAAAAFDKRRITVTRLARRGVAG